MNARRGEETLTPPRAEPERHRERYLFLDKF